MTLALKTSVSGYKKVDIREAVSYALVSAAAQSQQRFDYYANACREFEQRFGMTSDEFVQKFNAGDLGDDLIYFDWYAAKRGLDIWQERREILSGVSV
jgi:predicted S18 family serine protease